MWFLAAFIFTALLGLMEFFAFFPRGSGFRRFRWIPYVVLVGYALCLFGIGVGKWLPSGMTAHGEAFAVFAVVGLMVLQSLFKPLEGTKSFFEMAVTLFAFCYVVVLLSFLFQIIVLPLKDASGGSSAHFYVLYLIAITKFTDMGAYCVGSLIGKHKMIPHISPGKTWQGFGGAILFALIASVGGWYLMQSKLLLITPVHAVILGVLLAIVAVVGDLAESILKRTLAVKDSSQVMPGIGGVLDLIDSVLFTGPVFFFYLLYLLS